MLGDTGANALGALLGLAATRLGRRPRLAVLAGLVALNAASEYVSFTKVIAGNPVLNRIDMLGRRPAAVPVPAPRRSRRPRTPSGHPSRRKPDRRATASPRAPPRRTGRPRQNLHERAPPETPPPARRSAAVRTTGGPGRRRRHRGHHRAVAAGRVRAHLRLLADGHHVLPEPGVLHLDAVPQHRLRDRRGRRARQHGRAGAGRAPPSAATASRSAGSGRRCSPGSSC